MYTHNLCFEQNKKEGPNKKESKVFTAENHNRPTLFQRVIGMNDSTFTDMEILTRTLTWCETECTPLEDERDGTTNKDERTDSEGIVP